MRDALSKVLGKLDDEPTVDRILERGFFGERARATTSPARVIVLADRRRSATRGMVDDGFLTGGGRR